MPKTLGRAWLLVGHPERSSVIRAACPLQLWYLQTADSPDTGKNPTLYPRVPSSRNGIES
jgi:hypothetical protein